MEEKERKKERKKEKKEKSLSKILQDMSKGNKIAGAANFDNSAWCLSNAYTETLSRARKQSNKKGANPQNLMQNSVITPDQVVP